MKTKISIVIPTYNGAKDLKRQIITLINDCKKKNIRNFYELVISDNCSTDNTEKIALKFKKNKIVKINYYKSKKNTGYYSNFLTSIKLATSKYILFLTDDNIPQKNFYNKLYYLFKNKNYKKLCIFPTDIFKNYKKKLFGLNELAYVFMRGSSLSGTLLEKKKIRYKYVVKKGLYPQNGIFVDYYLNYGLKMFNCEEKIICHSDLTVSSRFDDRMGRKNDLAVIDKINSIDKFYEQKKINYFQLFHCLYNIYSGAFFVREELIKNKKKNLAKLFFNSIIPKNRKCLIYVSILFAYIRRYL